MPRSLHSVILAGGEGKRMKSPVPKVLIDLLGRPLLGHVLEAGAACGPRSQIVVGGRHLPAMRKAFGGHPELVFARQAKPLGTAHAVKQALKHLPKRNADVLLLCGDVPLIRGETLAALLAHHRRAGTGLTVGTALVPDPTGLGRILREESGRFVAIREERDCSEEEARVREINAGLYVARVELLHRLLPRIKRANAQGEYYLTDLVQLSDGPVEAFALPDAAEARGINRPSELAEARRLLQERILEAHRESGVAIPHPEHVVCEVDVTIAAGSVVLPFCVLEAGVTVPAPSTVGPFAYCARGTVFEAGTPSAAQGAPGALAGALAASKAVAGSDAKRSATAKVSRPKASPRPSRKRSRAR